MRFQVLLLLVYLILFVSVPCGMADVPLMKLLFNDSSELITENVGSLGGTQYLPITSGGGNVKVLSTAFASVKSWFQTGLAPIVHPDFNLPEMSEVTGHLHIQIKERFLLL